MESEVVGEKILPQSTQSTQRRKAEEEKGELEGGCLAHVEYVQDWWG